MKDIKSTLGTIRRTAKRGDQKLCTSSTPSRTLRGKIQAVKIKYPRNVYNNLVVMLFLIIYI